MPRLLLLALCAGLAASAAPRPAGAAPTVEIRARTQIELEPIRRRLGAVVVSGRVTDKFSDAPVPWVEVRVSLGPYARTTSTDGEGLFEAEFDAPDGTYDLSVEFAGADSFSPTRHELANMDVTKGALLLTVSADATADYSAESVRAVVNARSRYSGPAQVRAEVYAGPVKGELAHMGAVVTDDGGRGVIDLDPARLGGPGRKRVQVRYGGDRAFNPAEAQTDFSLVTPTAITFAIDDAEVAYESSIKGRGRVVDAAGAGVPRAPVAMLVGARRVGETLTDADGNFVLRASGSEIGAGRFNVQALFDPTVDWHQRSRSDVIAVSVEQPRPIPIAYTIAAFAATALAMVAFIGLRTRPWQGLLARLRRRTAKPDTRAPGDDDAPAPARGLVPARPSLVSTLRRPHDVGFTGGVADAITGRPVAGALVTLEADAPAGEGDAGAERREAIADRAGKFAFEDLPAGSFRVRVRAPGYVTERFAIALPHRGELRGARIDLLSVRERIFQIYRDAALPLLPDRALWGIWTPRQIFDHVRAQRPAAGLQALTDFVEEAYFSQRAPDEDVLDRAADLTVRARAEDVPGGPTIPDARA